MDALAFHILIQFIRRGDFDAADVEEIAARLDAEGEPDAAHAARAALLEAFEPSEAEFRRSKMHVVTLRPDGGNGAA